MLSEPTLAFLCGLAWRGNVRELKHAIERACVLTAHPLLRPDDFEAQDEMVSTPSWLGAVAKTRVISDNGSSSSGHIVSLADYNREQERRYIVQVLDHHGGQMAQTAEALGISRKTLWDKTRKLGIKGTTALP